MIEVNSIPLGELQEDQIRALDDRAMRTAIADAQVQTVGGEDLTPEETANCVMIMIMQRKSAVRNNPRASAAAKANADASVGSFDDFSSRNPHKFLSDTSEVYKPTIEPPDDFSSRADDTDGID